MPPPTPPPAPPGAPTPSAPMPSVPTQSDDLRIVIHKAARTLIVYRADRIERRYQVALGRNSTADKAVEGDEATPLGEFYICAKNPRSKFFLSMCVSYPNAEDAQRGLAANLITRAEHSAILAALERRAMPPQWTRLGGEIYIHGQDPVAGTAAFRDWTRGCIALEDPAMRELFDLSAIGTPVLITP
jgi:murein L,D-transpeptidase YafK